MQFLKHYIGLRTGVNQRRQRTTFTGLLRFMNRGVIVYTGDLMKKYLLTASVLLLASCSHVDQKRTTSSEDTEATCKSVTERRTQVYAALSRIEGAAANMQDPKTKELYSSYLAGVKQRIEKFNADMDMNMSECQRGVYANVIQHRNHVFTNDLLQQSALFSNTLNNSIVYDQSCKKVKRSFGFGDNPPLILINFKEYAFNGTNTGPYYFRIDADFAAISSLYNSANPLKVQCIKDKNRSVSYDEKSNTISLGYSSDTNVEVFGAGLLGTPPVSVRTNREIDFMKLYEAVMSKVQQ